MTTLSNWMSDLPGSARINEITMPGTHDSAALYEPSLDALGAGVSLPTGLTICQRLGIKDQLEAGVRFLDIRLKQEKDVLNVYHGPVFQNQHFVQIADACTEFLKANPREVILMSIQREGEPENNARQESFHACLLRFIAEYPGYFHTGTSIPTLDEVRGKIVIIRRFGEDVKVDDKLIRTGIDFGDRNLIDLQDDYEVPSAAVLGIDAVRVAGFQDGWKWGRVKAHLDKAFATGPDNKLWISFASGTSGRPLGGPLPVAEDIRADLTSYIQAAVDRKPAVAWILLLDFVDMFPVAVAGLISRSRRRFGLPDLPLAAGSTEGFASWDVQFDAQGYQTVGDPQSRVIRGIAEHAPRLKHLLVMVHGTGHDTLSSAKGQYGAFLRSMRSGYQRLAGSSPLGTADLDEVGVCCVGWASGSAISLSHMNAETAERGLAPFIAETARQCPGLDIHIVSHSMGGRLAGDVLRFLPENVQLGSMLFIQGALAKSFFANRGSGKQDRVRGPIIATYSENDGTLRVSRDGLSPVIGGTALISFSRAIGGFNDVDMRDWDDTTRPAPYVFSTKSTKIYNIDCKNYIPSHNEFYNEEVSALLLYGSGILGPAGRRARIRFLGRPEEYLIAHPHDKPSGQSYGRTVYCGRISWNTHADPVWRVVTTSSANGETVYRLFNEGYGEYLSASDSSFWNRGGEYQTFTWFPGNATGYTEWLMKPDGRIYSHSHGNRYLAATDVANGPAYHVRLRDNAVDGSDDARWAFEYLD